MRSEHIVKAYDDELRSLDRDLRRMGSLADAQIAAAIGALMNGDAAAARRVVAGDQAIDQLERDVHWQALRVLALRQPFARDLRDVVSALKIASELERICDHAAAIAQRSIALGAAAPHPLGAIPPMAGLAAQLLADVLEAHEARDAEKAMAARARDEALGAMSAALFRELLTHLADKPCSAAAITHLQFIAKSIERIGDHATSIAETVHFMASGFPVREGRPARHGSGLAA